MNKQFVRHEFDIPLGPVTAEIVKCPVQFAYRINTAAVTFNRYHRGAIRSMS
ncbi:hypothetical protein D3C75_1324280 [compost metagenome]